jgi:peroxiredoxin
MRNAESWCTLWFVALSSWVLAQPNNSVPSETVLVPKNLRPLVSHRLLPLLHAPEVHAELKLDDQQVARLEDWFSEVDGPWFRARILPQDAQWLELDRLEAATRRWLTQHWRPETLQRLQQLEWQSLGTRMFLRDDFAVAMKLAPEQQQKIAELARATEAAARNVAGASPQPDAVRAASQAQQAEREGIPRLLKPDQQRRFSELTGAPFATEKLKRIYPMAPELVPVPDWINSSPVTLKSLRGKVVLVHFYAFQCHNCQANFDIYRRWHEKLEEQGVVVLGIQTPETSLERDPKAVIRAATEKGLDFPILVDLKSENWKAWGNTMWPTVYVIDKRGYLRHWWQGELNWQGATGDTTIEHVVDDALSEPDPV